MKDTKISMEADRRIGIREAIENPKMAMKKAAQVAQVDGSESFKKKILKT